MNDNSDTGRRAFLSIFGGVTGITPLSSTAVGQTNAEYSEYDTETGVSVEFLGRHSAGGFDEGGAEIPAYAPNEERIFVVNGNNRSLDVLDISDPAEPTRVDAIHFSGGEETTNISVTNIGGTEVLAAAVLADPSTDNGRVAFYDAADLSELGSISVGSHPDMVTFTDDGNYVLTANEGEPTDDYSTDPAGSVSIVDISNGVGNATERTASFSKFDGQEAALRDRGIRIYGPNASTSQDLEPEYIATAGGTAYVTLQENNALAMVDIATAEVTELTALGYKDFSLPKNALDAIDDEQIDITTQPVYGMYQPDTIQAYQSDGETYLVVANEGDAREYDALFEMGVLKNVDGQWGLDTTEDDGDNLDIIVDESQFDDGVLESLAELEVTAEYGDTDGDSELEELHLFGARSISIHDADGNRIYESGDDIERRVAAEEPAYFNSDDDENGLDEESAASGPEQEGIAIGGCVESLDGVGVGR